MNTYKVFPCLILDPVRAGYGIWITVDNNPVGDSIFTFENYNKAIEQCDILNEEGNREPIYWNNNYD